MDLARIGAAVRSARRAMKMTQEQLARRAGVSRATINGLETGALRELGFRKVEDVMSAVGLRLVAAAEAGRRKVCGRARSRPAPGVTPRPGVEAVVGEMARRYIWWKGPGLPRADYWRVVAQVMDVGTLEDVQRLARAVGRESMTEALARARPGWFRPASWAFWHAALGLSEGGAAPQLPRRRVDELPDPD